MRVAARSSRLRETTSCAREDASVDYLAEAEKELSQKQRAGDDSTALTSKRTILLIGAAILACVALAALAAPFVPRMLRRRALAAKERLLIDKVQELNGTIRGWDRNENDQINLDARADGFVSRVGRGYTIDFYRTSADDDTLAWLGAFFSENGPEHGMRLLKLDCRKTLITDIGLEHLRGLNVQHIYFGGSKVPPEAFDRLGDLNLAREPRN